MQKKTGVLSSILYIEDDNISREIVSMFLKDYFMVDTATESSEAINKINKNRYAIILLDISLCKGLNGLELAREIKKMKNYKDIPIIAVTAHAFKEDEDRILKSGFTHYMSKPFTKTSLLEKINKALGK
ncbi:MAG TPA: response regulator [Ignavibacteriaceae bacterium]|nr:response regulator [Ignavibacteriaceae bacterium]